MPESKAKSRTRAKKPAVAAKAEEQYFTYPVRIRVVSQKGGCAYRHHVGQEWMTKYVLGEPAELPGICFAAFNAMLPTLKALWWGAPLPFPAKVPDTMTCACTDANNPVVFELKRFKDRPISIRFPDDIVHLDAPETECKPK